MLIQVEARVIQPKSDVEQHPFHLCSRATFVANNKYLRRAAKALVVSELMAT